MSKDTPPLVSFIVVAYNQDKYIKKAVLGAFSQTYQPLEIILSDDGSSDLTFEIMQDMVEKYVGPHKIILNKNKNNIGLVSHINHICEMSSGEIIILAAGDDISLPQRSERSVQLLSDDSVAVSFSSNVFYHNDEVEAYKSHTNISNVITSHDWTEYLENPYFHLNGAARSFNKEVFDKFGSINLNCPTEDSVILLRALLSGKVKNSSEVMIHYRKHEDSLSAPNNLIKMDFNAVNEQFSSDIKTANTEGLISANDLNSLNMVLKKRNDEIISLNTFKSAGGGILPYLRFILFTGTVSNRRKISTLKKMFFG